MTAAAALISLPDPQSAPLAVSDLRALIAKRESLRDYSRAPLALAELSYLLWGTQGLREIERREKVHQAHGALRRRTPPL